MSTIADKRRVTPKAPAAEARAEATAGSTKRRLGRLLKRRTKGWRKL